MHVHTHVHMHRHTYECSSSDYSSKETSIALFFKSILDILIEGLFCTVPYIRPKKAILPAVLFRKMTHIDDIIKQSRTSQEIPDDFLV